MKKHLFIILFLTAACNSSQRELNDSNFDTIPSAVYNEPAPSVPEQLKLLNTVIGARNNMDDFIKEKYPEALKYKNNLEGYPLFNEDYIAKVHPVNFTLYDRMMQFNAWQSLAHKTLKDLTFRMEFMPDTAQQRLKTEIAAIQQQ